MWMVQLHLRTDPLPPPIHYPPEQYKKAKADKLDLVGEDQRRMLEYRKQVGRRARGWYTG
jgi:hypothetical protein